jgi:hypothetical protein
MQYVDVRPELVVPRPSRKNSALLALKGYLLYRSFLLRPGVVPGVYCRFETWWSRTRTTAGGSSD